MYPGAIPINTAASRPAEGDVDISEVRRYAAKAVRPENAGASRTQMLRISTGMESSRRRWYIAPLVTIRPG